MKGKKRTHLRKMCWTCGCCHEKHWYIIIAETRKRLPNENEKREREIERERKRVWGGLNTIQMMCNCLYVHKIFIVLLPILCAILWRCVKRNFSLAVSQAIKRDTSKCDLMATVMWRAALRCSLRYAHKALNIHSDRAKMKKKRTVKRRSNRK